MFPLRERGGGARTAVLLLAVALVLFSGRVASAIAAVAESPGAPAGAGSGCAECGGRVIPAQRFILRLRPDERVERLLVGEGSSVAQGAVLARLSADAVDALRAQLTGEIIRLEEAAATTRILRVRVEGARRELAAVRREIEEERELKQRLPDYPAAARVRDLERSRGAREFELELQTEELAAAAALDGERAALLGLLKQRRDRLREREAQLVIKAPFRGKVVRLARFAANLAPGDVLLELWDEQQVMVRAEVWQNQLAFFPVGAVVTVTPHQMERAGASGTVVAVGVPTETRGDGSYPVFPIEVRIVGPASGLTAGMSVTVRAQASGVAKP